MKPGKIYMVYNEEHDVLTGHRSFEDAMEKIKAYYLDYITLSTTIKTISDTHVHVTVIAQSRFVNNIATFKYDIYETEINA